jgi:hypothetical protein
MTWTNSGDLICDCCGRIVIKANEVNEKDLEENTGRTICMRCWNIMQKHHPETD